MSWRLFLIVSVLLLVRGRVEGQDYRFSQYYNAPLVLNPALTGNFNRDYRLHMNYRNQWSSISNAFKTFSGSYDMPMFEEISGRSKVGFGIMFLSDKSGTTNYGFNNVNLSLAYHLKTDRYSQISAGLVLGYAQKSANLNSVKWESQHNGNNYDPSINSGETAFIENYGYFDAGIGLNWSRVDVENDREYGIGISATHLNFPNSSFIAKYDDRLRPKIQVHGSIDFGYEYLKFCPKILLVNQGPAYSFNIGGLFKFNLSDKEESRFTDAHVASSFEVGLFYRYHESLIIVAQYEFKKSLLIGLSYDVNMGKISAISSSGGIEVAVKYQGLFKNTRIKIKNLMDKEKKDKPNKKPSKASPNIRM